MADLSMEDLDMSPQEKLFYSGVCPSLRASTPKREREVGVPDPKKARLAMAVGLDADSSYQSDPWGPASQKGSPKGKGKGKSGKGGKGKMSRGSWTWGTEWDQADWSHSWNQSRYGSMEDLVTRMSQLMIKHEFAINSLKQDTTVYFFVKPGAQGLLPILFSTSERWHQVQRDTPDKPEESLRLVLLKALLLELGQRLRNFLESQESQKAARDLGWITGVGSMEGSRMESSDGGTGGAAGWEDLGNEHCGDGRATQACQPGDCVPFSVAEGAHQGSSDGMGPAGPGTQCEGSGNPSLGSGTILDWLRGLSYPGLSPPPRERRPVESGSLSSLVTAMTQSGEDARTWKPGAHFGRFFHLAQWNVADGPAGLSVALQCLLWPMWQDPGRQDTTPGLIKHLWNRIARAPRATLHLRGDLFWMPLASRWCTVHAHPTALLRLMLSHFSTTPKSGEWGMHLPLSGLLPERPRNAPGLSAPPLTLQERVDAWAISIGRPVLCSYADTVYLSLEDICTRAQGVRDASWPFIRPHPCLADVLCLPGLNPDGTFMQYQYEIKTLVYQHSSEVGLSYYTAEHWFSQKMPRPASCPVAALHTTTNLCLLALRATGQETPWRNVAAY